MRLYFLRHAEASYDAASDHDRPLTQRGQDRTQTAANVMKRLGIEPAYIFSSPRVRARDTAQIVADALKMDVDIHEAVNFSFSRAKLHNLIRELDEGDDVMFVGHNPSMSEVVSDLCGADINMKKGGLARIDLDTVTPMRGSLVWLIAPKVFDALGD